MSTKTRKPRRGLGYSVEEIHRQAGTRYRAYVWDAVAQRKQSVPAPDGSKTFEFYEQAEAAAKVLRQRIDGTYTDAGLPVQRQSRRFLFEEYAALWLTTQGGTAATRRARKYGVNTLNKAFGKRMMDELTETDFKAWDAAEEARGMSTSIRQQRIWVLRAMMQQAQKDGVRPDNPAADVWVKAHRNRAPRYLTLQELYTLIAFAPMWFWPAILLGYFVGLRAGEIAGLRWERIDLDSNNPHVLVSDVMEPGRTLRTFPKGTEAEPVALPPVVVNALKVLRKWRGSVEREDHVFLNTLGRPIDSDYPNKVLAKTWKRSGLPGQRPVFHHLRHNTGNNLAEADAPAPVIMAVLRHKSLATSQKYIKAVDTRRQQAWMARAHEVAEMPNAQVVEFPAHRERGDAPKQAVAS
ncbi:tyrosine-type recombinase/integrase [Amycolatopsis pittospori]|uniref:tyrosine-type recombinase/integrase n=1 Tax=Amycolatopsis pittospori TaxID=2749434 RepID=UPI0015F0E729|nr:tyrosine-type recombinase/integrase [Amycolatopsis pittospori]